MAIDPEKERIFNEYLDEVFPEDLEAPHPFSRFVHAEIVLHPEFGIGIVTGFNIPDVAREFHGLGVQFVIAGVMTSHRVFNPVEAGELTGTGIVFNSRKHGHLSLEDVLRMESDCE